MMFLPPIPTSIAVVNNSDCSIGDADCLFQPLHVAANNDGTRIVTSKQGGTDGVTIITVPVGASPTPNIDYFLTSANCPISVPACLDRPRDIVLNSSGSLAFVGVHNFAALETGYVVIINTDTGGILSVVSDSNCPSGSSGCLMNIPQSPVTDDTFLYVGTSDIFGQNGQIVAIDISDANNPNIVDILTRTDCINAGYAAGECFYHPYLSIGGNNILFAGSRTSGSLTAIKMLEP